MIFLRSCQEVAKKFLVTAMSKKIVIMFVLRLVGVFTVFVSNRLISSNFQVFEVSKYYLLSPFTTFFTTLFVAPFSIYIFNISIKNKIDLLEYLKSFLFVLIVIAIVAALAVFVSLDEYGHLRFTLALFILIEIIVGTLMGLIVQRYSLEGKFLNSSALGSIIIVLNLIFSLFFCNFYGWNVNSWILGILVSRISQVFIILSFAYLGHLNFNGKQIAIFENDVNRKLIDILKLSFTNVTGWLNYNAPQILLASCLSFSEIGPILFVLSMSLTIAITLESFFKPMIEKNIKDTVNGIESPLFNTDRLYFAMAVVGFIAVPIILDFVSNEKFKEYTSISRFIFVYEVLKLRFGLKGSIQQIVVGYNKYIIVNILIFLLFMVIGFCFIFYDSALTYFWVFYVIMSILVLKLTHFLNE